MYCRDLRDAFRACGQVLFVPEALATGQLTGLDGGVTTWQLRSAAPDNVRPEEQDHAADLIAHGLDA